MAPPAGGFTEQRGKQDVANATFLE